ncbi:efflux RND transporter periplasmic adaptor subunit [Echinicola shivajiensis]|uniref:efflux RND transporter periplasmic adaptor subunit n=1 Tax=Echinicola shivajiensis TaxID=1035916 RepID=UPI001BFCAB58|nr:efflux RND transporter periplasmic adaptor subunit [Echinicola shivajiensis]
MKRITIIMLLIVLISVIGFVLWTNRNEMRKASLLAETKVEKIPVNIFTVRQSSPSASFRLSGQLSPSSELVLLSQTQGEILSLSKGKGQWVEIGEEIAAVEDLLYKEEYELSKLAYEKLRIDLERFKRMEEGEAITSQQREGVELNLNTAKAKYLAAQKQLENAHIKAPIAGFINQMFVKKGSLIGIGAPVCEIVNTSSLILKLNLAEKEVLGLESAKEIRVVVPSMPGDTLIGKLEFVSVKADHNNQYEAEITLVNEKARFKAGMIGLALLDNEPDEEGIYIPIGSLMDVGEKEEYVYVVEQGRAIRKNVVSGARYGDYIEILKGVQPGDRVILEGKNRIDPEQAVVVISE